MVSDDVFNRRWILTEDEVLRMLWRCYGGENPDVALLELYASGRQAQSSGRSSRGAGRARRVTRHCQRGSAGFRDGPRRR